MIISTTAGIAGNYYVEDDGIPGNAKAQIRGPGLLNVYTHPFGNLAFESAPGQKYIVNLLDSMLSDFTIGSFANPAFNPDQINVRRVSLKFKTTLVTTGQIVESGNDPDPDIMSGHMALSAGTGIGKSDRIETEVFAIEAATVTGGINLRNFGNAQIGGSSTDIAGLTVVASGNIDFENVGNLTLVDVGGPATIVGGTVGNVALTLIGATSSLTSTVDQQAIVAAGGNIVVTAGKDITLGNGTSFDNDMRASGSITLAAGGNISVDGSAEIVSDEAGGNTGGSVTVTAGAHILVNDAWGIGASIRASGLAGADVLLTAGGKFDLQAPSSTAISSMSGDVTVNADHMIIAADSGISALNGTVTLRPTTEGKRINVEEIPDNLNSPLLHLSDAEIDRVFAKQLVIGGESAGSVIITTGSLTPANVPDLVLQSGADVLVQGGGAISVAGKLTLLAADDVVLYSGAMLSAGNGIDVHVDFGNTDPGEGGSVIVAPSFAASLNLFGDTDNDTLGAGSGNDRLDGGAGADKMTGRLGNDAYDVDNVGDKTIEAADEGIDAVSSSISWSLAANVENLALTGGAAIDGTGNLENNVILGNTGNNTLKGGAGNDIMLGGAGTDLLQGGDDNDTLAGGAGDDTLNGQAGTDTAVYADATAGVKVALISGAQDTLGAGIDTLASIENLTGSNFNDSLTGDGNANVLNGGGGKDLLIGGGGGDTLLGGEGRDVLTGGDGADFFHYRTVADTGTTATTWDTIKDFTQGSDIINLGAIDADTTMAANQAFAFIGAAAFAGIAGQLRAEQGAGKTLISGDINGDAAADFAIELSGLHTLTATDFTL
ncbi:MAG: hypothetical protein KIS73_08520 [Enhydrobacter sp.]|nr:hypothetical protein [Enhydrobacter sp.]